MNNYEISPMTIKSGDSLKYSDSECTRDFGNNPNISRKSSVEFEGGNRRMAQTVVKHTNHLNSDLHEQCDFYPSQEPDGEMRITNADGTFKFVLTEVVSGKPKMDLCHQSHASERCYSERSNSTINYSNDIEFASVENSVEDSDFIRNLMYRQNLSPPSANRPHRDDPQIFVGSLSEVSNDSNIPLTDPDQYEDQNIENHPIRVESNRDSEDEVEEEICEDLRYPELQEISEKQADVETDGHSSVCRK